MNIYLVQRDEDEDDIGWNQYHSAVVIAENENAARRVLPFGRMWIKEDMIHTLKVTNVGTADANFPKAIILKAETGT